MQICIRFMVSSVDLAEVSTALRILGRKTAFLVFGIMIDRLEIGTT